MSSLPIVNFYALRIGAAGYNAEGDFIDNQTDNLCVFVADCGEDYSHTVVHIPNIGNFVYEDELFMTIAVDIVKKLNLGSIPSDLAAGLLKTGYENDLDGLIDVNQAYEDTAFNAGDSEDISDYAPCYFVVASFTNDIDDTVIDLATGNLTHETESLDNLSDLYGRIDETDSFVTGVPA